MRHKQHTTMEDVEVVIYLLLGLWIFVGNKLKEQSRRRLRAARQNTLEKQRRVWEAIERYHAEDEAIRRRQRLRMALLLQNSRCKPSVWAVKRCSQWWDFIVPGFTNDQWLQNFRMSEETFSFLCNRVRPVIERQNTSFRECVPLKKRVGIALWKLATGSEYRNIGQLFGVGVTTVCRCVREFCAAAETLLVPEQIRFPDEGRFREMAVYIEDRWGLPQCVGAIDTAHMPIIAPQNSRSHYSNCEGGHSVILQGVVDGKGLFWDVFAGLPGSLNDASVLRQSKLWELASRGNLFPAHTRNIGAVTSGYYILGDSAYPLQDWLMKPFHDVGRLTAEQRMFNHKLSRARVVVENAFSRLKGRWRCLLKRNDCDIRLVKSIVRTCCALHNLCESRGETYETSRDAPAVSPEPEPVAQDVEEEDRDVRDALMHYMLSR